MDLNKLNLFHIVSRSGSYKAAAKQVGLTPPSVNKQIKSLEKDLGVTLFNRHKSGVRVTKDGEKLLSLSKKLISEFNLVNRCFSKEIESKSISVSTSIGIASDWLLQFIPSFLDTHNISMSIISNINNEDIGFTEADLTIGPKDEHQSHCIQRKLYTFTFDYYASKKYLSEYGTPKTLHDLKNHRIITSPNVTKLPFSEVNEFNSNVTEYKSKIEINTSIGEYNLIKNNLGIGIVSKDLTIFNHTDVKKVFPEINPREVDIYFIYHKNSSKIKILEEFYNHIMDRIQKGLLLRK